MVGRIIILAISSLLLTGCPTPTSTSVQEVSVTPGNVPDTKTEVSANGSSLSSGDGIVALPGLDREALSDAPVCVANALAGALGARMIEANVFRDAMFPWFEPGTVPEKPEQMAKLIARPAVRGALRQLGIRYLVIVGDMVTYKEGSGGIAPYISLYYGTEETRLSARVWNLQDLAATTDFKALTRGSELIAGILMPFIFEAYTEGTTCSGLGRRIAKRLKKEHIPQAR